MVADEGFASSPFGANLNRTLSGSVDPADLRARLRTPAEVNWSWMARFDHDFVGREHVEAEQAQPRRRTVTLRWSPDDVLDVVASYFRQGDPYSFIEFPVAPRALAGGHADHVSRGGRRVGVSSQAVYSYYHREMLSQCVIDLEHAEIGTEVVIDWGEFGGPIKRIRATVERFPYLQLPRNRDYPIGDVPSGV